MLAIFVFAGYSCKRENRCDCFKSRGKIVTETRSPGEFNEIEIASLMDVYLVPDSENKVVIEAGEHLMKLISTEVSDGRLILKNRNKCNWVRSYKKRIKVEVHTTRIDLIEIPGECDLFSTDTLRSDRMEVNITAGVNKIGLITKCNELHFTVHAGTGDFVMGGIAGTAYIYNLGTGYFDGQNLITGTTYITSKSTGDCYIYASGLIEAKLLNSGDIFYYGHPGTTKILEKTGSGNLISAE
jgi:hypothetical protein